MIAVNNDILYVIDYHELRFIRQWEKETGRTMYVAGFGPDSASMGAIQRQGWSGWVVTILRKIVGGVCLVGGIILGSVGLIQVMAAFIIIIGNQLRLIQYPHNPMVGLKMGGEFLLGSLPFVGLGLFLLRYR